MVCCRAEIAERRYRKAIIAVQSRLRTAIAMRKLAKLKQERKRQQVKERQREQEAQREKERQRTEELQRQREEERKRQLEERERKRQERQRQREPERRRQLEQKSHDRELAKRNSPVKRYPGILMSHGFLTFHPFSAVSVFIHFRPLVDMFSRSFCVSRKEIQASCGTLLVDTQKTPMLEPRKLLVTLVNQANSCAGWPEHRKSCPCSTMGLAALHEIANRECVLSHVLIIDACQANLLRHVANLKNPLKSPGNPPRIGLFNRGLGGFLHNRRGFSVKSKLNLIKPKSSHV